MYGKYFENKFPCGYTASSTGRKPHKTLPYKLWGHVTFSSLTMGKMAKQAKRFAILVQLFFRPYHTLGKALLIEIATAT